ncbi:MAG TPA: DegV family protein [Bacillota bacterium]|nr:DegV family protein [Bacillota bacterium]
MSKIAIVTDSTSDLTPAQAIEYNIHIRPLYVVFGDTMYKDGIDIQPDEFYEKLKSAQALPTTSQPSPGEFIELYEALFASGYDSIVSVHLSSGLSGTAAAARQAAETLGKDIHVFDSHSISAGVAVQVMAAARAVKSGKMLPEVLAILEKCRKNVEVVFTLNTLEYLAKGGRIGKAKGLLGSLLNIKPIIKVEDGIYVDAGKARSQKQALEQMVDLFVDLAKGRKAVEFVVAEGMAEASGLHLKSRLEETFGIEGIICKVGPVVGVHTGPGTVGAAVLYE